MSAARVAAFRQMLADRNIHAHGGETESIPALLLAALSSEPACVSYGILEDVRCSLAVFQSAIHNCVSDNAEDLSIKDADYFLWRLQEKVELAREIATIEKFVAIEDAVEKNDNDWAKHFKENPDHAKTPVKEKKKGAS